jgi:hypothetical protein
MLAEIGACFQVEGTYAGCERYHGGHINETYFATYRRNGSTRRYVHQRINTFVFRDPEALTHNVATVTRHMRDKLVREGAPDIDRRVLRLVPTRDGADLLVTQNGDRWRTYAFIEGTTGRVHVEQPRDAFEAARAFGEFARVIADLPAASLHETIPGFHDTHARFRLLLATIAADRQNRAAAARCEIASALAYEPLCHALPDLAKEHTLPLRAAHNDTKITNVLFDVRSARAVCVVDLDTVMPGLTLYDVGELVRTAATRAAEDEPDPSRVCVDRELFDAVANGFVEGAQDLISPVERRAFVMAGKVLAFENGVRFLTDHLEGDVYFRVHRANHNLDRARAQFALVASLERSEEDLCKTLS